jgi:hypothetical protein
MIPRSYPYERTGTMKSWLTALIAALVALPLPANADDLSKWIGTYSCPERNFVTVKRLSFTKEKDGHTKIHGVLVGFPDEVSIGDATADSYADRNNRNYTDALLASFSSEKFKPFMVITPGQLDGTHYSYIRFTCYMKDVDGANIHITGTLNREKP